MPGQDKLRGDQRKVERKDGVMTIEYPGGMTARTNMADLDEMERALSTAIDTELASPQKPKKKSGWCW